MILKDADFELFEQIISQYDKFVILPHYNPDPDAIAASYAMQYLLNKVFDKKSVIVYSGIIGRAENNVMVNILNIKMQNINDRDIPKDPIILLDTQPFSGNNPITGDDKPVIIIDHHMIISTSQQIPYADLRIDFGSTCSIVCQYYKHYKLKPTINIATAMYYGIQSDVIGEGRTAFDVDFDEMETLAKSISNEKLFKIINPKLPFDYYIHIQKGLQNCMLYGELMISTLGEVNNPDYIAEVADLLIRYDQGFYVLMIGLYNNTILLSFRSQRKKIDAGVTIKKIIGSYGSAGGHSSFAGGRITLEDEDDAPKIIKKMITKAIDIIYPDKTVSGIPFLSKTDYLPNL